ncbi:outer membrane beta-barrel protein [Pedobacter sp. AW31-3R]|uniref:outer membrane beta-barrel protein n=1 Tax=Pedobacter sp. AW31-3R TaxID=3445781 RepID=UPI003FA022E4
MKKLFLLTAIAGMFAFSNVSAQTDPAMGGSKLGIGAEFAFPTGDFGDFTDFGYGGSLQFQTPIVEKLNFTASAGYLNFKYKDEFGGGSFGNIPVKAGVNYFLAENFYIGGELGAAFGTGDNSNTSFVYTPHIGVEFPVADKSSIDLGARYEAWSNDGTRRFVGLRLAYNFGL